jgi:hypothetical protein
LSDVVVTTSEWGTNVTLVVPVTWGEDSVTVSGVPSVSETTRFPLESVMPDAVFVPELWKIALPLLLT